MKTRSLVLILVAFFILALIAFIPLPVLAGQVARFTSVEGNVDLTAPGMAAKRVFAGDTIQVGDIIRTKSKSKCEVTFIDGNILRFAENTRLRVTEYMLEQNQRKEILNLDRGKIRNMVLKASKSAAGFSRNLKYEVHTPTAVCGVRGTDFVSYHQDGITGVTFKEGAGYGYSNNKPQKVQTIAANQTMLATSPDQPPVVRPATATELGQHMKDTEPSKKSKKEESKKEDKGGKKDGTLTAGKEEGNKDKGTEQGKEENKNEDGKAGQEGKETSGGKDSAKTDQGKSTNESSDGNKASEDAPKVVEASKPADSNEQSKAVDIVAKSDSDSSLGTTTPDGTTGTPTESTSGTSSSSDSPSSSPSTTASTDGATGTTASAATSGSLSSTTSGTGVDTPTTTGSNSGATSSTAATGAASGSAFEPGTAVTTTLAASSVLPTATTPTSSLTSTPTVSNSLTTNQVTDIASLVPAVHTPLELTLNTNTAVMTNSKEATFTFQANESATYSYRFDGGDWITTSESSVSLSYLEEKQHTIEVLAIDSAGNKSASKSYTWTTDYTAPTVTLVSNRPSLTNLPTVTLTAQASESLKSYSFSTDDKTWTTASVPTFNLQDLSEGEQTFYLKATDEAGNTSAVQSYAWTTDYTSPIFSVSPESASLTAPGQTSVKVKLTGTDASPIQYGYRIYETGGSPPSDYTTVESPSFEMHLLGYKEGSYTLDVKGADGAGNVSVSHPWYLTQTKQGEVSGELLGTYKSGDLWKAVSFGALGPNDEPLKLNGSVNIGGIGYYDTVSKDVVSNHSINGILGSTAPLLQTFGPANIVGMGSYTPAEGPLFAADVSATESDPGAVNGSLKLLYTGIYDENGSEGRIAGIYIKDTGGTYDAGLVRSSSVLGKFYPEIGIWEILSGSLTAEQKISGLTSLPGVEASDATLGYVGGDLSGTVRIKSYELVRPGLAESDYYLNRGIWEVIGGGTYSGTPVSVWTAHIGETEENAYGKESYMIMHPYGTNWANGRFSGVLSGRFLNTDNTGSLNSDFLGRYSDTDKSWQGVAIGTYEAEPLTFSSLLNNGSIMSLTKGAIREVDYEKKQDGREDFVRYSYGYFSGDLVSGKKGGQFESLENSGNGDADYEYFPNGRYVKWEGGEGVKSIVEAGITSQSLDLEAESPVGNLSYSLSYFTPGYYKVTDLSWTSGGSVCTGSVTGIMGGSGDLWTASESTADDNAAEIVLMGDYQTEVPTVEHNLPTGFGCNFDSWRENQTYGTTTDGGAYKGFISGRIGSSGGLEGFLYGLYIAPDNSAGILKGKFTGSAYPEVSMWEADGTIHPIWKTNATKENISATGLLDSSNLSQYSIFLDKAAGVFKGDASTSGSLSGWYGYGGTLSIRGEDWGIYQLVFAVDNKYDNPDRFSAWQGGLSGNGGFGRFAVTNNSVTTWTPDIGLWLAHIPADDSSWSNGRISALMDGGYGKFLTYTKMGVLKDGQLLGSYIPDSEGSTNGIWSASSMGVWEKTADLSYSSVVSGNSYYLRHIREGRYEYSDGSVYEYDYNDDHPVNGTQRFGHSYYENKSSGTIVQVDYFKGGVDIWTNEGTGSYRYTDGGTYEQTEAGLSAALDNAPVSGWSSAHSSSEFTFDYEYVTGIMGGLNYDLWTTSTGTGITFLGQFDTDSAAAVPSIFSGNIVSFNPKLTMDSYTGTTSPLGGAYFGAIGGSVYNDGTTDSAWKNSLNGSIYALYVDPGNNVGILKGSLTGSAYPQINAWEAEGTWTPVQMASGITGIDPSIFHDDANGLIRAIETQRNYYDGEMPSGTTTGGGQITLGTMETRVAWVDNPALYASSAGPAWGIVQIILGGSYAYTVDDQKTLLTTPLGNFDISYDGHNVQFGESSYPKETSYLSYTQNMASFATDKGGYFEGAAIGARIDLTQGNTSLLALNVNGTFDPVTTTTWQAVSTGAWIETGKFIDMAASSDTARAALAALNIPCFQVGSVNLEGKGNNLDVKMNNLNFYASSTGGIPKIWATKDFTGSTYSGTPNLGTSIQLSGGGIKTDFTPIRWDNNKWAAAVNNGMGTLTGSSNSYSVQFKGGAAGSYNAGTFGGTGAGIVNATKK